MKMCSFYRPQRSWVKVIFSQASVILITGGGSASVHAGIPLTPLPLGPGRPPRLGRPQDQADTLARPGRHPYPPGPGRHTPPPRAEHTWRYGQQVGGMHPTGMQSCYHLQRSWGKVIFSQASVILFTGTPPPEQAGRQAHPPPTRQAGRPPPGEEHTWRYGQRADRMHPTGIQSCWKCFNF